MARTEPTTVIARLANRHAAQMSADAQHDEPLGFLDTVVVGLRVAEGLDVYGAGVFDFRFGAVADEDGLAAPFDDYLEKKFSVMRIEISGEERLEYLTFLPSGIAARSTSTLACARTSADADMLTRKSERNGAMSVNALEKPLLGTSFRCRKPSLSAPGKVQRCLPLTLYCCLCPGRSQQSHRSNHEVLKHSVRRLGILAHIFPKARYLRRR